MSKILTYVLLLIWGVNNAVAGIYIAEQKITPLQAETLNFHRLIDGTSKLWDNSWIILVYPEIDTNKQPISEVCISVKNNTKKLASLCTAIIDSEIYGFKRSDIEVSNGVVVSVDYTYGSIRYSLDNALSLTGLDYETFKKRYNKRLNSDND